MIWWKLKLWWYSARKWLPWVLGAGCFFMLGVLVAMMTEGRIVC